MMEQKLQNNEPNEIETREKRGSSWKFTVLFLAFVLGLGISVFYQFSRPSRLTGEGNPTNDLNSLSEGVEIGKLAPDFTSEDVYGNKTSLSNFRNKKPVLLVFWATWCGFCAKELPDLKAFAEKHQDKIQVIAVSSGEAKKTIEDYIQEKDVNFLMLLDEQREIWKWYLVRGTPAHFLIDKQGKILTLRPGLASIDNLETMLTMLK